MGWSGEHGNSLMSCYTSCLNNQEVWQWVSEFPVRHDRTYIIVFLTWQYIITAEMKSPLIELFYIFILGFCVVVRKFCLVRHPCDVTAGLSCDVTPGNQGILWRHTIVASPARAKLYPTCEISILFTAIFTGDHVRITNIHKSNNKFHFWCNASKTKGGS